MLPITTGRRVWVTKTFASLGLSKVGEMALRKSILNF